MSRRNPFPLARLKLDKGFQPCPVEPGEEAYPNGIFEFNITRLLAFVQEHADRFPVERAVGLLSSLSPVVSRMKIDGH